jgi:hypothetical protein
LLLRLIGSVAITVPSATWLWQQGPKKSDHSDHHGHGDHEDNEEQKESEGESENQEGLEESEGKPLKNGQPQKESGDESSEESDEGGDDKKAEKEEDKRPIGESVRNEPPNEITSAENKSTSGDEGLKEGSDDALHKKSQQVKSIDLDADEGKKDGPSDDFDKGHEGEEKGTRVTDQDEKRKVGDFMSALFPSIEHLPFVLSFRWLALS